VACSGGDLVLPEGSPSIAAEAARGNEQSAAPGEELPQPIVVKVTDAEGDPVPDVRVAFELGAGAEGGETTPDTATTNENGEASTVWVLGNGLGEQRVDAEVVGAGIPIVSFTATAMEDPPGPNAEQSSITASPESIEAITGLSVIRVTVRDGGGDPLAGATVTLAASGVGNVLNQPTASTGEDGVAEGSFQAITPGTKVISAVVNGEVTIIETASVEVVLTPTADRLVFLVQPSDTEEDETISPAVAVAIVDDDGDVVALSGVEIHLELIRENGERSDELEGTTTQLTVDGVAAFPDLRVDRDDHDYRLRATAPVRPELGSVDSETFDIEH
jgi:Invasin, domain 3